MIIADVNVLLSAYRPDATAHNVCREWLSRAIHGDERFGVSTLVLSGVVRIATNRRAFDPPSDIADAFAFCQDLLDQPHAVRIEPGPRHWQIFSRLCSQAGIHGARTTDAWFAALAIEAGADWITLDRDFARFAELKWTLLGET